MERKYCPYQSFVSFSLCLFLGLGLLLFPLPATAQDNANNKLIVEGNHSPGQLNHLHESIEELLVAHSAFLEDCGLPSRPNHHIRVTLLASAEEFHRHKSQSGTRSESPRGYYDYRQNQIVSWETMSFGFSSELRRILVHETFHHQLHHVLGEEIPLWLNEGLAVLFENAEWVTGMRLDQGNMNRGALAQVKSDYENHQLYSLEKLLHMDRNEFYQNHSQKNYSQAWSFVHFLVNDPIQKNRGTLPTVLKAIQNRQDPVIALEKASGRSLQNLETDWHHYLTRL